MLVLQNPRASTIAWSMAATALCQIPRYDEELASKPAAAHRAALVDIGQDLIQESVIGLVVADAVDHACSPADICQLGSPLCSPGSQPDRPSHLASLMLTPQCYHAFEVCLVVYGH